MAVSYTNDAAAQNDPDELFADANVLFGQGEYAAAIAIYDDLLEEYPGNSDILRQKGIAQSNNNRHRESLITFYTILQNNPNDTVALAGTGIGFGNLGEYQESISYFDRAITLEPDNEIYQNYADFVNGIIAKYPYTPTLKPPAPVVAINTIVPAWTLNVTDWWVQNSISDTEYFDMINYLIAERVIVVPHVHNVIADSENAQQLALDLRAKLESQTLDIVNLVSTIQDMADAGFVILPLDDPGHDPRHVKNRSIWFKNYLTKIVSNVDKEKRYIEYPNPSGQVIKKFLRDYLIWNFESEAQHASTSFKDPRTSTSDNTLTLHYNVFVNQQPSGLPLDHVSTLDDALEYWEAQTLRSDGMDVKVVFNITNLKQDANVWVTWVVRDLGESVLGHANVGKGIVEVTLGGYACDGSFQLYDVFSVLKVMTHELGHSIGLGHSDDQESIMYRSLTPTYAYCLV